MYARACVRGKGRRRRRVEFPRNRLRSRFSGSYAERRAAARRCRFAQSLGAVSRRGTARSRCVVRSDAKEARRRRWRTCRVARRRLPRRNRARALLFYLSRRRSRSPTWANRAVRSMANEKNVVFLTTKPTSRLTYHFHAFNTQFRCGYFPV